MKQVKFRSVLLLLLIVLLGLGLALFCLRYTFRGGGVGLLLRQRSCLHRRRGPHRSGAGPQRHRPL